MSHYNNINNNKSAGWFVISRRRRYNSSKRPKSRSISLSSSMEVRRSFTNYTEHHNGGQTISMEMVDSEVSLMLMRSSLSIQSNNLNMNCNQEKFTTQFKPPEELLKVMKVPQKTLMGPGPSNCSERVLRSLQQQVLGHMHPETFKIMDDVKSGIQYIFQTRNRLTLALSASAHAGMEASIGNVLERGETLLIVKSGFWGDRAADMASRMGINVHFLETENGTICDIKDLEVVLKKHRPDAVFMVHSESSVGMKQPIEGFGNVVHKYGSLLIVDTVASVGAEPFFADAWGVDVVYTGSQKALGGPPGITPISFSPLAEKKIFERKTKVPVFYWDVTVLGNYWACFGRPRIYHHTISITLLYGLREALSQVVQEGLPAAWSRHALATERLHRGLQIRGLEFYVKNPEHRLKTITAVKIPAHVDVMIVLKAAMETYNVEIAGGLGPTASKIFRIGLMGANATSGHVDLVLRALDKGLRHSNL